MRFLFRIVSVLVTSYIVKNDIILLLNFKSFFLVFYEKLCDIKGNSFLNYNIKPNF